MPSLLNASNVYEIRVRSTVATMDQEFDQIWNYIWETSSPGTAATKTTVDMLTAFRTAFRAGFLPIMDPAFQVQRYELREITGSVVAPHPPTHNKLTYHDLVDFNGVAADKGTRTGPLDYLPPYASVSFERRIARVGREFFGVSRIGPVAETDQGDGTFTAPGQALWVTALGFATTTLTLAAGPPVESMAPVLFRKTAYLKSTPGPLNYPALFANLWESSNVALRLGTQLSRKETIRQFGS